MLTKSFKIPAALECKLDAALMTLLTLCGISVKKLNSLKHPVRTTVAGSHN